MSKSNQSPEFFSGLSESGFHSKTAGSGSISVPAFSSGLNKSSVSVPEFSSGLEHSLGLPISVARQPIIDQSWQIKPTELEIGKLLGKGSYGQVYLGKYHHEQVAVKIYDSRSKIAEKEQKEIYQEAKMMAGLRSQYLVDFRGVTFIDQRYCLVMEYCEGGTLRKHLDDKTMPVSWRDQLRWGLQMSDGLYQLHSLKILHRDLKSENILLDKYYNAKIADFGLSVIKASSSSQSSHGLHSAAGTLPWMAPELFSGEDHTPASDSYSLGMILWEIASRKKPFQGIASHTIVGMVLAGTRLPLDDAWPSIFKKLINACWEANPSKRPSAKALGDEFQAVLKSLDSLPTSVSEKKEMASPPAQQQLLQFVVAGEQDQAESLLQKNPSLLLSAGAVTDLSNRSFKNITAFQYAVWAGDWHMWKMLLKYLPTQEATSQLLKLEAKGTEYGRHFSFNPIILAMQTYIEYAKKVWNYDHSAQYQWGKVIGELQKKFPAFVVNEYCRPDRSFVPQPDFKEEKLPRSRKLFAFSPEDNQEWFTAKSDLEPKGFVLKDSFAFFRNNQKSARLLTKGPDPEALLYDLLALLILNDACHKELKSLRDQLLSKLSESHALSVIASTSEQKAQADRAQYAEELKAPASLLQNRLVRGCEQGDLKEVQMVVLKGASVSKPNSIGKQPLGAAIWGMNPEIVRYILSQSSTGLMTWSEYEQHNQQFYDRTFLFTAFDPQSIIDWKYLLDWMELSPFLQEKHLQKIENSFAQDWQSLKKKVMDAIYDLDFEITHEGQTASTASVFLDLRTQIKQMIGPATDLFKLKPTPEPATSIRQDSKCLIM